MLFCFAINSLGVIFFILNTVKKLAPGILHLTCQQISEFEVLFHVYAIDLYQSPARDYVFPLSVVFSQRSSRLICLNMLSINLEIGFNGVLDVLDQDFNADTKCRAWRTFDVSNDSLRLNFLICFVIFTEWLMIRECRVEFGGMDDLDLEARIGWMDDHTRLADNRDNHWQIKGERILYSDVRIVEQAVNPCEKDRKYLSTSHQMPS
jgi:hypothetical protein